MQSAVGSKKSQKIQIGVVDSHRGIVARAHPYSSLTVAEECPHLTSWLPQQPRSITRLAVAHPHAQRVHCPLHSVGCLQPFRSLTGEAPFAQRLVPGEMAVIKPPRADIEDKAVAFRITIYIRIANTNILDAVHAHRASIARLRLERHEAIAVVSAQSVPCCHPDHSLFVLYETRCVMVRQSIEFVEPSLCNALLSPSPAVLKGRHSLSDVARQTANPHQKISYYSVFSHLCNGRLVILFAKVRNNSQKKKSNPKFLFNFA